MQNSNSNAGANAQQSTEAEVPTSSSHNAKPNVSGSLREKSLQWFFDLNDVQKIELKEKYYPDTFIDYDSKWGFHYTFGQIEEMYQKAVA